MDVRNCASLLKLTHLLKKNASFDKLDYSKVTGVLDVEMSIPAQLVLDVTLAVKDRCPVHTCLRSGGEIMSRDHVVAAAKAILDKEGA